MLKKIKAIICLAVALVAMLSLGNTTVLAAETKSITVNVPKSFTIPSSQVAAYMNQLTNSTYYHDDGTYKGTLGFSRITSWKQTFIATNTSGDIYQFDLSVEYTGIVTRYFLDNSKNVTMTIQKIITCPATDITYYVQAIQNSTYSYDDGNFCGVLNFSKIKTWAQRQVTTSMQVPVYEITIDVEYTGTVNYY